VIAAVLVLEILTMDTFCEQNWLLSTVEDCSPGKAIVAL